MSINITLMTFACYNSAKECFVMKLKQNSANCSIDIIWAMWVTVNGYTLLVIHYEEGFELNFKPNKTVTG